MGRRFLYWSVLVVVCFTSAVELLAVRITTGSFDALCVWRQVFLLFDSPLAAGLTTYVLGLIAQRADRQRSTAELTVRFGANSSGSGPIAGDPQVKQVRIKETTTIKFRQVHQGEFMVIEVPMGYELRHWSSVGDYPSRRGSGDDLQRWYSDKPANVDMFDVQFHIVLDEPAIAVD